MQEYSRVCRLDIAARIGPSPIKLHIQTQQQQQRPKAPFFFFFLFSQRFYCEEKQGFHSRGYDDALVLILLLCASFQRFNRIPSLYIHMYVLSLFTPLLQTTMKMTTTPPLPLPSKHT